MPKTRLSLATITFSHQALITALLGNSGSTHITDYDGFSISCTSVVTKANGQGGFGGGGQSMPSAPKANNNNQQNNNNPAPNFDDFDDFDDATDWPVGSFTLGVADFINSSGGDSRQQSSSDGVDMCQQDTFAWNTNRDIEYQVSPVNENTNPQGSPGEAGGLYDAGFDEVYDNIGEDQFLLTIQKEGSGSGSVVSTPLGIACGTDCTEVYFNGTLVTLFANASAGSEFIGWSGCPLVNGSNQCLISVTESDTVFAEFQPDDLIFSDGFE